jgi:trehalose 6-phosphate synthase
VTARIGFFLHVPFPAPQLFDCLPRADELLRDFGAFDVVGVQVPEDARNLNEMLERLGVEVRAGAFPIGINPSTLRSRMEKLGIAKHQSR